MTMTHVSLTVRRHTTMLIKRIFPIKSMAINSEQLLVLHQSFLVYVYTS